MNPSRFERRLMLILSQEQGRLGLSWEAIEKKCGVRACTVRNWLRGDRGPNLGTLLRVLDALGLEMKITRKDGGRRDGKGKGTADRGEPAADLERGALGESEGVQLHF